MQSEIILAKSMLVFSLQFCVLLVRFLGGGVIKSSRVQYWGVFPSFFRFALRDLRKIKQKRMRTACAFETIILANCV